MNVEFNVLACDIGASGGRMVSVGLSNGKLSFETVHKFPNAAIRVNNTLIWDIVGIFSEIKKGLVIARKNGIKADSFGIDTWGNDFALIDINGNMIENPYCYRDARTEGMIDFVDGIIGREALYLRNGVQHTRFNTLYQLAALAKERPYVFDNAARLLFIPDLLCYFLTGKAVNEYTLCTISQMYDYRTGGWDFELMERLGIPVSLFTQDIMASGQIGRISKNVCEELNIEPTPVLAVAAHDTASAVVSVPLPHEQAAYISSGTWSILGTEVDSPVIDLKGLKYNFANEGGLQGRIRFSRNIMGLWINQELQRGFELEGRQYTFAQMEDMARHAGRFTAYLDPDDELFYEPGNMPGKIIGYCAKTGQRQPESDGEVIRVVMEGLAFKYRYCLEQMEDLVSKKFDVLNIIGGGSKDGLLSQLTADCCGKPVYAGPSEATVLGNAMAQFITLHAVKDLDEARELIRDNYPANIYYPVHTGEWAAPFESFVRFIESGRP